MNGLRGMYSLLFDRFGPQEWWPGDTPFEVAVGAILTQNTSWRNVEKGIANLRKAGRLSARGMAGLSEGELASLVRPSGYFNQKSARLRGFIGYLQSSHRGSMKIMARSDTSRLRHELLALNGIGPETADSILLYALDKPVFVIDAYTKRVLSRHAFIDEAAPYQEVQELFHQQLEPDVPLYNEFHALFVRLCKIHCTKQSPTCSGCPLEELPHTI